MKNRYVIFNKPYGVLSQFTDEGTGHPTLKDFIPIPGIYPAGRLDRDSEGLLILTNDGRLIKRLTDPQDHVSKTYYVQVEGVYDDEKIHELRIGIEFKKYRTLACEVYLSEDPALSPREKPITPHGETFWLKMILREGKKRQIRHMTASVGWFTLRLFRWAIGPLTVDKLNPGQWRELSFREISGLF